MKEIELFDNFEEDGQLSLFRVDYDDWDEDWVEEEKGMEGEASESESSSAEGEESALAPASGAVAKGKSGMPAQSDAAHSQLSKNKKTSGKASAGQSDGIGGSYSMDMVSAGSEIRIKYCASCGKLLFVKEETTGFRSECNNCGIKYFQKL